MHDQKVIIKVWISWEWKELLGWNRKHSSSFLKGFQWKKVTVFLEDESVTLRWVFYEKYSNGELNVIVRLVTKGFQEDNSDILKDSHTCSKESMQLISASSKWLCLSTNIKSAFLQKVFSPKHWNTGLVSSGASLTSCREGASLALVGLVSRCFTPTSFSTHLLLLGWLKLNLASLLGQLRLA